MTMPSYPTDVPVGGAIGGANPYIGAGLAIGGAILGSMEDRKRRKRLAALRRSMMEQVDAGASAAKRSVGREAVLAQGGASQHAINSGFYNSTLASDAASSIGLGAGARMGEIEARAGSDKAQILADTFDQSGGTDYSGLGRIAGQIIGSNLSGSDLQSSETTQAAKATSPMLQQGGDPSVNSAMYDSDADPEPDAYGTIPDQKIQAALRRRSFGRGGGGR